MKTIANLKKFGIALVTSLMMSCTIQPVAAMTTQECSTLVEAIPYMNKVLRNQTLEEATKGLYVAFRKAGIEQEVIDLQLSILEYVDEVKDRYSIKKQQQEIMKSCLRASNKKGNV